MADGAVYVAPTIPSNGAETSQMAIANGSGGIWRPNTGLGMIAATTP